MKHYNATFIVSPVFGASFLVAVVVVVVVPLFSAGFAGVAGLAGVVGVTVTSGAFTEVSTKRLLYYPDRLIRMQMQIQF